MSRYFQRFSRSSSLRTFFKSSLPALALLLLSVPVAANTWYVSPTGSASGNGSLASPWDLQTALNQPTGVNPGDTILMLPGIYRTASLDGFTSNLNGTATNPIIVRNYYGNDYSQPHATIDANGTAFALNVIGTYTQFQDFELYDSSGNRTGDAPALADGVFCQGAGNNFVGLVVHDTVQGFSSFNACPNSSYDGNIAFFNGYIGSNRNYGHGMYMQNATGDKNLWSNFVGDNADEGLQIYGSANAQVTGFDIEWNSLWNTSSWPIAAYQYNLVLGDGATDTANTVSNNYSWFNLSVGYGFVDIGQYSSSANLTVQNNVFSGGWVTLGVQGVNGPFTFTGNTLVNSAYLSGAFGPVEQLVFGQFPGQTTAGYDWDFNNYYTLNSFYSGSYDGNSVSGGAIESFAQWQQGSGFDAHSTFSSAAPTGTWIYVSPDRFEAKRAGITIYNWALTSNVSVNLSSVLSPGDNFVIRDAQNFFGAAIVTGTYNGGSVTIPMTGLTKPCVIGVSPASGGCPPHTAPAYGTFVVIVPNAGSTTSGSPNPLTITTTSLAGGQSGVSYSATLTASGGASPYAWSAIGLPMGLSVTSGIITGIPSASGPFVVSLTVTDSVGNTANGSFNLTIAPPLVNQATVNFVKMDSTTEGNWSVNYGMAGYSIALGPTSVPANTTVSVANAATWTWASGSSDPRALQTGSAGLATCWFSTSAFSFTIDSSGGQQTFALYALDWDRTGRSETIQILDAVTKASLFSQQISNFSGGIYLVWQISGDVIINVTPNSGPNAVVSGIFWGGAGASIAATGGTPQSVSVGSAFAPLTATVISGGNPASGVQVTFTAPSTGVSGTFAGSGNTAITTTNTQGVATAPVFTANGSAGGPYTVTAATSGAPIAASFSLTNLTQVGPPASVTATGGASQSIATNTAFATPLQATVVDALNNPVPNVTVTFTAPSAGASGIFTGATNVGTAVTNAQGIATAPVFTANGTAGGPYTVTASASGAATSGSFSLTNLTPVGPPATVTATGGASQSAPANTTFATPLQATVVDALNNPVPNVTVTFTAPSAGASGIFTGATNVGTTVTNAQGVATAPTFTANGTAGGPYTVTASASGATTQGSFSLTNTQPVGCTTDCASFVSKDTTTEGSWEAKYGADGYSLANSAQSLPSYGSLTVQGEANYSWNAATSDPRALQVPGSPSGIAATWYGGTFTFNVNVGTSTHQVGLYVLDWDNQGRAEKVQIFDANSNSTTALDTETISNFSTGVYLIWNVTGNVRIVVTGTGGPNAVVSGVFFGGGPPAATVNSFTEDTSTEGAWQGKYGADGYSLANAAQSLPGYALLATQGQANYTWNAATSDPRALQIPGSTSGIAAAWYGGTFSFDLNVGTSAHQVGLYVLDWDNQGRAEKVQIFDANSNSTTALDTETISNFSTGAYLIWNITGHVKIVITVTGGPNAVVSGMFFGGAPTPAVVNSFSEDTSTEGAWKGKYGVDGYSLANSAQSLPGYATLAVQGQNNYTWNPGTSDPRALQIPGSTLGIAAAWYGGAFSFNVNVGSSAHQVELYVLDWDNQRRAEKVQIFDANSNSTTALDTETVSNFSTGAYLIWNVTGSVRIVVTVTGGPNAAVSGVFFQ